MRTGRTPASYWLAASLTSSRAAWICVATSASWWPTAWKSRERLAERLALRRVADGRVERGLGHPDAEGADARPEEVEGVHRDREAAADLSEHLLGPGRDAVEVEAADWVRCDELERARR